MLVITELILHVESCLKQIPKWIPLHFPYKLRHQNCAQQRSYQFEVDSRYISHHWFLQVLIMTIYTISAVYQILMEDTKVAAVSMHAFRVVLGITFTTTAYIHHLKGSTIARLLNELLNFERHWLDHKSESGKAFWRSVHYRRLVTFGLKLNRIILPLYCTSQAAKVALFPYFSLKHLPGVILDLFSKLSGCGKLCGVFASLSRRAFSFVFTYAGVYLICNQYFVLMTLSFFSTQGSMYFMVIALERFLNRETHHRPHPNEDERIDKIVGMFRETQIICGLYNDIHSMFVMAPLIISGLMGISVPICMLVTNWGSLDVQMVLVSCNLILICAGFIMLVSHFAVKFYLENKGLLASRNFGSQVSMRARKLLERYWRSFPVLKIFFFQGNFFENSTPLVLFDFSLNCAIDLILL